MIAKESVFCWVRMSRLKQLSFYVTETRHDEFQKHKPLSYQEFYTFCHYQIKIGNYFFEYECIYAWVQNEYLFNFTYNFIFLYINC